MNRSQPAGGTSFLDDASTNYKPIVGWIKLKASSKNEGRYQQKLQYIQL